MSLQILKGGILTTIQDLGRHGYRRSGINPNGVMDTTAVRLINLLLKNSENEAVLEMHFPAPEILFEKAAVFAVGGADFSPQLNGKPIENWRTQCAEKGDILTFQKKTYGSRVHLSVKGGFEIKEILDSKSTNLTAGFGGFDGRSLQKKDRLLFKHEINKNKGVANFKISNKILPFYSRFPTVRVVAGAEFEDLTGFSEQNLLNTDFIVLPNSDRMGFRLQGEPLYLLESEEILSSAVNFGTIQLLPDGQMIVLMADHQTSGGYPRIANVVACDLPLLAQLGTNDKIAFHLVSLAEAENLMLDLERDLNFLKTAVKFLV